MVEMPDVLTRISENLLARPNGPLALRFLIQPITASIFAIRDGLRDARNGRSPYFRTILTVADDRTMRLREGFAATGKIIILALILDTVYQLIEFTTFYPGEAPIVAIVLAFIPYLLIRGPATRIARWWCRPSSD
jgi:hypothetical protein